MTHATALLRIFSTARADRVLPSGWWIVPALAGGVVGWVVIIWAVMT